VSKASAGAVEAMDVYSCRNMPDTLGVAGQDGWRVLGASADPHAPLVTELPKGVPTVIVLGNEVRCGRPRCADGFRSRTAESSPWRQCSQQLYERDLLERLSRRGPLRKAAVEDGHLLLLLGHVCGIVKCRFFVFP
jgi:hypothetical protein